MSIFVSYLFDYGLGRNVCYVAGKTKMEIYGSDIRGVLHEGGSLNGWFRIPTRFRIPSLYVSLSL
jgi:hypothetical protein